MSISMVSAGALPGTGAADAVVRQFGPFLLRRALGHSTATMAWLAHDKRRSRDVLLMLPRAAWNDQAALNEWILLARRAARLDHPHLVPVVDLGTFDGWPYIACERAEGSRTLAERTEDDQPPSPDVAARWCSELLDGLAYAHEAGIAHGDIGLHALVEDRHGRLRLWGLGLDGRRIGITSDQSDPAQREHLRSACSRDVLGAGLLLHGWLTGRAALDEADLPRAVARLERELVRLPWDLPQPVPQALRAIVNRATDRHPPRRYLGARSLMQALQGWRQSCDGEHGALALLLERLPRVGALPARPGLGTRVAQLVAMEHRRLSDLADLVLEDPALSIELLRMVNTGVRGIRTDGVVITVRRALQLVGLLGVQRAASVLRPWPGPLHDRQTEAFEQAIRQAFLAGHVAELLTPAGIEPEDCLLVAQLQHLGRLLSLYHFPDETQQIRMLMAPAHGRMSSAEGTGIEMIPGMDERSAAMAVLGVDLDELAEAVLRHWGFDGRMLDLLRPLPRGSAISAPSQREGWVRVVASCANELLDAQQHPGINAVQTCTRVASRYNRLLGGTAEELAGIWDRASRRLDEHLALKRA